MSDSAPIEIIDVTDLPAFERIPPCAAARFDHRTCDYWEDDVRGSKAARTAWLQPSEPVRPQAARPMADNPFAPPPRGDGEYNPFAPASAEVTLSDNPFAPLPGTTPRSVTGEVPRKLRLLDRGRAVFGSYAKVLLLKGEPAVYAQFGPLSAYPRAQHIRDLYPSLPASPLPAVITCIATTSRARGGGLGRRLVEAVVDDLAGRGFAAVEAYPDRTLRPDEASAAEPAFWRACGFIIAAEDERYPVMRRELG